MEGVHWRHCVTYVCVCVDFELGVCVRVQRGLIALATLVVAGVVLRHLLMLPPPPGSSFGSTWHGSVRGQVKEL